MSLHRRGNRYASRITIPADLRPLIRRDEVLRSLFTDDPREARLRAQQWEGHVSTLFAQLRKNARHMSAEQIDSIVARYLNTQLREIEERLAMDEWKPNGPEWHETATDGLAERAEALEEALAVNNLKSTLEDARRMMPDASEPSLRVLARRLLEAQLEVTMAELQAMQGKPLRLTFIAPVAALGESPKASRMLLCEAIAGYVASQREVNAWAPKTDKSVSGILAALLDMLGDRPMQEITKADMAQLQSLLTRIPTHAAKRFRGLSLREAADAADAARNTERLSAKSKNIYLTWARTLWKWAVNFDHVSDNPTVVLAEFNEEDDRDQRDRFTDEQIVALMNQVEPERASAPAHWWVPRVMLYTGLRLEEAAKLRPCDVVEVEGIRCFDINQEAGRLKKGKQSERLVPIHSALLPHVLRLAQEVTTEFGPKANLWSLSADKSGRWSEQLSKRLNARLDSAGVNHRCLVIESARNTFGAKLNAAGVSLYTISEIYGHSSKADASLAMTKRYVGREQLQRMRDAIESLSLPVSFTSIDRAA
jgi:integrase